jgi:acylphosphatase
MKSLLLSALYSALKAYLGGGVYNRIAGQVMILMSATDMTGAEKMANVLAFAQREAIAASEYLIRAAVELILMRAKQEY